MQPKRRVCILYRSIPQYRLPFYERLRLTLVERGVELDVFYGDADKVEALKRDQQALTWGHYRPSWSCSFAGKSVIYQPVLSRLRHYDLVIVEQANKLLINYLLMAWRHFGGPGLAFWGHGRNMQDREQSLLNRFKYSHIRQCDWWFAYTNGVKDFLIGKGVRPERITVVQNAIDTSALLADAAALTPADVEAWRRTYRLSGPVGLYCGGLYREKCLPDLIEAADRVRRLVPDFSLIVVGDGPDRHIVEQAARTRPWLHCAGARFGKEKAAAFAAADLLLLPGLVGLAVVDAFAMQVPLVTRPALHSPEIEYLIDGVNGRLVEGSLDDYAQVVVELLRDAMRRQSLQDGCRIAAATITMDAMVMRFADGIDDFFQRGLVK